MSVTYGFYNSLNGDRKYNAEQMSSIFDGLIIDGVFASIGTAFIVKAAAGITVNVGIGKAWFNHTWTINDAILPLEAPESEVLLDRIDAIVLEVNAMESVRKNSIKFVKGVPSSKPVRPTLTNEDKVHQYPFCYIYRKKGSTMITQADITNMVGSNETPFITAMLQTISLNDLLGQWQSELDQFVAARKDEVDQWIEDEENDFVAWFDQMKADLRTEQNFLDQWIENEKADFLAWYDQMKDQLSEDAAGNLWNHIDDLEGYVGYTDTDIYGLEADFAANTFTRLAGAAGKNPGADFDSIGAFGGRRRCNVTNEGAVTAYYGDAGYTETGKLTKAVTVDGTEYPVGYPVQVMVEQPRFYYRVVPLVLEPVENGRGCHLRKARYYVSDTPRAGFRLHPAFISNGKEKQAVYLSAYEGCLWDASASAYIKDDAQVGDFNTDMLSSIAGAKPASGVGVQNLSRSNARKLAENRGPGWEMAYAATLSVSQLLMVIEYASFHMQRAIGQGAVSKTDDGASNLAENTGATASLGNASGTATNSNNIQMVSYRGEENLWGNIMEMVDGMNILNPDPFTAGQSGQLFVADHGFKENTGDLPYQETGLYPVYGAGFISAFGYSPEFDWLFVASELKGNLNFPVGDYFSSSDTGWRFPVVSGEWHRSNAAGPFYMNLAFVYGRSRNTNARLVYIPQGSQDPPAKEPVYQYEKGAANGVATLDSGAKVPVPQIPAANSLQVLNLGPIPTSDRLQTGQDLNNYITPGSYWCTGTAIAESLINCPYRGRFKLVVDEASSGGEIVYQYIIPGHTGENSVYTIYYRVRDMLWIPASPWGNWKTLLSVVGGNKNSIQQTSALLNLRQEEGAWTPVLIARSGPAVSYTITENRGCKYWTLGDWVYITCYLRVRITAAGDGSSGSRSYAGIQGLPFAVSTESRYPITVTELYGCVSNNWDVGYIDDDGGSSVYFQKDDGAAQEWWMVNSSTDGGINFCGWYKKAT